VASCQSGELSEWRVVRVASCKVAICQSGELSGWRVVRVTRCQGGELKSDESIFVF
jgi:hypothetical protein